MTTQSIKKSAGRILVVDDEMLNRTLLFTNLSQAGHEVTLAESGEAALKYLQEESFDVVLLDLIMPGMDGYAILARIKANPAWQNIPVIVISGLDDTSSMVECIKLGAADYLHKPFDPVLLKARLEASLANKRLRDLEQETQQQLAAQKDLLQQLVTVARTVAQSPSLARTIENVIKVAISLSSADRGRLTLLTEDGHVVPYVLDGSEQIVARPGQKVDSIRDTGLAGWVVEHGQPVLVKDTHQDERWTIARGEDESARSVLCVPVFHQQLLLGVLTLTHSRPAHFRGETLGLMQAAADQMALAIRNAQTFENQRLMARRQATVYEVLRKAGEYFEPDELVEAAVSVIQDHTTWPNVLLIMPTADERQLVVRASRGPIAPPQGQVLLIGNGPVGQAFSRVQTVYEPELRTLAAQENGDELAPDAPASELAVPLRHGAQVLGILVVISSETHAFQPEDIQLAELLASTVGLALHNANLYSDMRSYLADLSALFNVAQVAGQSIVLQEVLDHALTAALSSLGFESGLITLTEMTGAGALRLSASYNLPPLMKHTAEQDGFAGSLCEYVHRRQQSLVITDLNEIFSPSIRRMTQGLEEYGFTAYAGTPLLHQERSLGTICLFARAESLPAAITPALLEAIGSQVATAVANARLHQAIAQEHNRLQTLIDSSRDGIILIGEAQQILVANTAALTLLDLPGSPSEWIEQPVRRALRALQAYAPAVVKAAAAEMESIKNDSTHIGEGEYEVGDHHIHWQNLPVVINGLSLGRLLVLRDVTQTKLIDRMRDDLTHTMVHDLRNPLTAITVALDLFGRTTPDMNEKQKKFLKMTKRSSQHMLDLVNAILDVSQLESGQLSPVFDEVALAEIIEDVFAQQQILADEKQIALVREWPADLPTAWVDVRLIRRVLQNLVGNALKFTPQAGVVAVAVEPCLEKGLLEVAVRDTGPGIPAEIQGGIFQKFFTGAQENSGNGLGLAFCRLAVESHGGKIWVDSQPGEGAVFKFTVQVRVQ